MELSVSTNSGSPEVPEGFRESPCLKDEFEKGISYTSKDLAEGFVIGCWLPGFAVLGNLVASELQVLQDLLGAEWVERLPASPPEGLHWLTVESFCFLSLLCAQP